MTPAFAFEEDDQPRVAHRHQLGASRVQNSSLMHFWRPTCSASSLVGTTMTACVPEDLSIFSGLEIRYCATGTRYAKVLPVPVLAFISTSAPRMRAGMAPFCTWVNCVAVNLCSMFSTSLGSRASLRRGWEDQERMQEK